VARCRPRATRCISLIAADGLTANRRAASRIELPRSTARTILSRSVTALCSCTALSPPLAGPATVAKDPVDRRLRGSTKVVSLDVV
jgi:hypothetical protein